MSQFLPRGYHADSINIITRMLSSGDKWQIYSTNRNSYVLAVKTDLYEKWVSDCGLSEMLFKSGPENDCRIFVSSDCGIISSVENGPYPTEFYQIESFSVAFKKAVDSFPNADLHDAIYIEDCSVILPISFDCGTSDNATVYGRWLTGGINISIDSIDRVSRIMSWLPKSSIEDAAAKAGFRVKSPFEREEVQLQNQRVREPEKTAERNKQKPINGKFTLVGRPELEQFFNDNIIDIVLRREEYERMGISFPGATILYGPPGCGKTYAVEKLAEFLGWERFDIDASSIASSYVHDTSKKISEVFHSAMDAAPSILVIDEMEAFLTDRGMAGPSGTHHVEEVAEFLRRIPEAISKGVLVFAMTNMIDSIDPAIRRRGRFDHIVEVKMATAEEIEALLVSKFAELPIESDVSPKAISEKLDSHPMSDINFVLKEAGRFAVKRNLDKINNECFESAINLLPKKKEDKKIGFHE